MRMRVFYSNSNGDRWYLVTEPLTGRVFVRHQVSWASGGTIADLEIEAFLTRDGTRPQQQELLRLIGTLTQLVSA